MVQITRDLVQPRGANLTPRGDSSISRAFTTRPSTVGRGLSSLGKSLAGASDDVSSILLRMAEQDNETRAKQADARVAQRVRNIVLGNPRDPEAPPGFLHTRGETTLDAFGPAEDAVRSIVQEEVEAAGNNQQLVGMINQRAQRRIDNALDRMVGHTAEQRLASQESARRAREAQAHADAVGDWQSDAALDDAIKDTSAETLDRAEATGVKDDETIAAMLREKHSIVIKGAFDAALTSSDVIRAQAIFSKHADKLTGPTRNTMAQALQADVQSVMAQALANEAVRLHPGDPGAAREYIRKAVDGKAESAAIAQFNSLVTEQRQDLRFEDSKAESQRAIESAARTEANHLHAVRERRRKQKIREARVIGYTYADEHSDDIPNITEFRAAHPEAYRVLSDAGEINKLVDTFRKTAVGVLYATASDGKTLAGIKTMPYEERATLTEGDLLRFRPQLTKSEYDQAVTSVAAAKHKSEADAKNRSVYAAAESALVRARPLNFNIKKSQKHKDQAALASSAMVEFIRNRIEAGKFPTQPEINAEAARLMMPIVAETAWMDGISDFDGLVVQFGDMEPEQRAIATVPVDRIPDPILRNINKMIDEGRGGKWAGIRNTITDDVMEELAGAFAMGDRERFERILDGLLR